MSDIQHYDYLIVGAGMAAASAVEGIRKYDAEGSIGILGDEADPPATRPALSKKLWLDPSFSLQRIWMHPEEAPNTHLYLRHHVITLDRACHTVRCSNGMSFHYHRLLIATGGKPALQQLPPSERVIYFRTVADYRLLRAWTHTDSAPRIVVVGGSWLGIELAAALCQQPEDIRIKWVISQQAVGCDRFPAELSTWLEHQFTAHGVEIIAGNHVLQGDENDAEVALILEDGADISADAVVMCTGITLCDELALTSDLATDNGIVVNEYLQTTDSDIFAAGDIACYPDAQLGYRRVEHVDNAQTMGNWAGRNMASTPTPYRHTPYFYTRLFGLDLKGIGHMSTELQLICHWQTPPADNVMPCGVIIYIQDDSIIKGITLINIKDTHQGLAWANKVLGTQDVTAPAFLSCI